MNINLHSKAILVSAVTLGLVASAWASNQYAPADHVVTVEQLPSITIVGHRPAPAVEQLQSITVVGHRQPSLASVHAAAAKSVA